MKRNETNKQEQKNQNQTEQQPIIRVQSRLRAGALSGVLVDCKI